jgi:hypothetical protein
MALSKQTKLFFPDFGMAETLSEEMTMDGVTPRQYKINEINDK